MAVAAALAWAVQTGLIETDSRSLALSKDTTTRQPTVLRGGDAWTGAAFGTQSLTRARDHVGRVTYVRDGDTIEIGSTALRLANLDCAEKGTVEGDIATARLRDLVAGKTLDCTLQGRKSYDREVATCRLSNGQTLSSVMIAKGFCRRWR